MVLQLRHVGGVRILREGVVHQTHKELAQGGRSCILVANSGYDLATKKNKLQKQTHAVVSDCCFLQAGKGPSSATSITITYQGIE